MLLVTLAAGCGRDKEPVTAIQDVPDPAMQASAAPDSSDAAVDGIADAAGQAADVSDGPPGDRSIVDLASRRVYLPGRGWLTAEEFRLVYQRRPEILPPDLDMAAAHQLIGSPTEM